MNVTVTINIQKTYAGVQITTNLHGQVYYELKLIDLDDTMSLKELKT